MSSLDARRASSINRRLQILLLLLILWDGIALLAEVSFGGPLFELSGDRISGLLAARGSFSGVTVVPVALYGYAFLRGPLRHRNILWAAVCEQGAGALFAVYHSAAGDIKFEGAILPLVVSAALFVLLLLNLPRGQVTT